MIKIVLRPILRYRKSLGAVLIVLAIVPLFLLGVRIHYVLTENAELQKALAETDEADAGWRMEEIEGNRLVLKDEDNGAIQVLKTQKLIPSGWWAQGAKLDPNEIPFTWACLQLAPEEKLDDWHTAELRALLRQAAPAVTEARKLINYSSGRFPPARPQSPILPQKVPTETRSVSDLLELDCLLLAQDNKIDLALLDAQAIVKAARSIGDEPELIAQVIRRSCRNLAVICLERVLAQGQTSDSALGQLQQLLEKDESESLLLIMAQGERAEWHRLMQALEAGEIDIDQIIGKPPDLPLSPLNLYFPTLPLCHAWILRFMNKYVEIAKGPPQDQEQQLKELEASLANAPILAKKLLHAWVGDRLVSEARYENRGRAWLRCAIIGVAVERYRLSRGTWPDSLSDLVPQFIHQLPNDPFDGNALRYRKTANGVIIYCSAPDKEDTGGVVQKQKPSGELSQSANLGFRLWDVEKRRQPPRPVSKENEPQQ